MCTTVWKPLISNPRQAVAGVRAKKVVETGDEDANPTSR
jgi:hypothetical protein